jgi:hypothetical protein
VRDLYRGKSISVGRRRGEGGVLYLAEVMKSLVGLFTEYLVDLEQVECEINGEPDLGLGCRGQTAVKLIGPGNE